MNNKIQIIRLNSVLAMFSKMFVESGDFKYYVRCSKIRNAIQQLKRG